MSDYGLYGPYDLTSMGINAAVQPALPGVYVLGTSLDGTRLGAKYVGRSDTDLNRRLHEHVSEYPHFMFRYANGASQAYALECAMYQEFENLDNKVHPGAP